MVRFRNMPYIFHCDDFLAIPTKSRVFLRNSQLRTSARKLPRSREIRNSTWEAKIKKRRRTKRLLLISGRISEDKKRTLATVSGGRSQWAVTTDRLWVSSPLCRGLFWIRDTEEGRRLDPGPPTLASCPTGRLGKCSRVWGYSKPQSINRKPHEILLKVFQTVMYLKCKK